MYALTNYAKIKTTFVRIGTNLDLCQKAGPSKLNDDFILFHQEKKRRIDALLKLKINIDQQTLFVL